MTCFLVSLNANLGFKVSFMYSRLTGQAGQAGDTNQCKFNSCQCQVSRQAEIALGFIFTERTEVEKIEYIRNSIIMTTSSVHYTISGYCLQRKVPGIFYNLHKAVN